MLCFAYAGFYTVQNLPAVNGLVYQPIYKRSCNAWPLHGSLQKEFDTNSKIWLIIYRSISKLTTYPKCHDDDFQNISTKIKTLLTSKSETREKITQTV